MRKKLNIKPSYGSTNPTPEEQGRAAVKRFGSVIGLKPEKEKYYRELHAATWPSVLERLRDSHIRNYSIYVTELEGKRHLFSYFEYTGEDYEADTRAIAEDPETQRWWRETDPCQIQLPNRQAGAQWTGMEMVFFAK